jgi:hypothetical protein
MSDKPKPDDADDEVPGHDRRRAWWPLKDIDQLREYVGAREHDTELLDLARRRIDT